MPLKLLQPGLRPLGQFDFEDSDTAVGGELVVAASNQDSDGAASDAGVGFSMTLDSTNGAAGSRLFIGTTVMNDASATGWKTSQTFTEQGSGPFDASDGTQINFKLADDLLDHSAASYTGLYGLSDDGTSGYGTLFGTAIGGTAGQGTQTGTGYGTLNGNASALGPNSYFASGKVSVFTKAGLYGVTDATLRTTDGATNTLLGVAEDADAISTYKGLLSANSDDGKSGGTTAQTASQSCALLIGKQYDSSLVSTTSLAAGGSAEVELYAIYFLGCRGPIS